MSCPEQVEKRKLHTFRIRVQDLQMREVERVYPLHMQP